MAAEMAVASPLLDDISVEGATGVLINIVGGPDLKMKEIQEAASLVQEQAHEDANIIFGASIDETLGENVKVTVIATGFDAEERQAAIESASQRVSIAPQTIQSARPQQYTQPIAMRPQAPAIEQVPAMSTRRVQHAHEARTAPSQSIQRAPASRAPASSATDPFPNFDNEWDVPAFQRKQR
jgi:cell division protein FtsZ